MLKLTIYDAKPHTAGQGQGQQHHSWPGQGQQHHWALQTTHKSRVHALGAFTTPRRNAKNSSCFFTYEINSERKNKTQNLNSANIIEQMAVGHIRRTMSTLHSQVGSHSVMGTPGSPLLRG